MTFIPPRMRLTRNSQSGSARCARTDLGRWLKGNYRMPTEETPDDSEEG